MSRRKPPSPWRDSRRTYPSIEAAAVKAAAIRRRFKREAWPTVTNGRIHIRYVANR